MGVIVLASAAGSPGVTTSALGLALTWHRPVLLIEADPTGGSAILAGFFRGTTAQTTGLLDLAWAHREGLLEDALTELPMPIPDSSASLLPGVRSHTQARSLAALWDPLPHPSWQPHRAVGAAGGLVERAGTHRSGCDHRRRPSRPDRFTGTADLCSGSDVVGDALGFGGFGSGEVVG